jgi:hypothetical protein
MKTQLITLLLLILTVHVSLSQRMMLTPGVEKTVSEYQYGATLLLQTNKKWGLGGFYQTGISKEEEGTVKKNPFYGAVLYAPLSKTDKINFYATLRCGVVNENFVVIVPGLETQLRLFKNFQAGFGMGYRMGYPSVSCKIYTSIF